MRDFKSMKRQRGRNRSGGGGQSTGGKPQNANRAFDSNGPDNMKVRGHAQHVFEKYQQLARDATSSGDRVLAENFLQHAEHYFRVLRTLQPNRPIADFIARETFSSGYDIDFEDESGAQALPDEQPEISENQNGGDEQPRGDYQPRDNQQRDNQQRDGQQRDGQQRDNAQRDGREPRQDRWENRGERQSRDNQSRDGQPRDNQQRDGQQRDGQQRDGQQRDGQQPREGRDRDRNFRDRDRAPREDRGYRTESEGGEARSERPREDRDGGYRERSYRDDRPREDNTAREDRPREDRPRQERGERRDRSFDRGGERADPLAVVEPQAQPLIRESAGEPAPVAAAPEVSVLRSHDGETSHAPAFLQAAPTTPTVIDEAPVKRPRGRPRKVKDEAPAE